MLQSVGGQNRNKTGSTLVKWKEYYLFSTFVIIFEEKFILAHGECMVIDHSISNIQALYIPKNVLFHNCDGVKTVFKNCFFLLPAKKLRGLIAP